MFLLFFLLSSNSELDIYGLKLIVKRLKTIWKYCIYSSIHSWWIDK